MAGFLDARWVAVLAFVVAASACTDESGGGQRMGGGARECTIDAECLATAEARVAVYCEIVLRVEDRCYAGVALGTTYDCALTDEQILAAAGR
jgi:hypothetical protein